MEIAARRGTGGSFSGSGTHLILVQGELVLSRGWLTHEIPQLSGLCVLSSILPSLTRLINLRQCHPSPSSKKYPENSLSSVL